MRILLPLLLLPVTAMSQSPAPTPPPAAAKLLTWPDLTKRSQPKPDATISYGPDSMQKVDVWLPPQARLPYRTVLMVHGGCWTTSIADRSLMNWIADDLRKAGYAVWNIDYRGVDRAGGGYPGTFTDVTTAANALRDHAARFHLDTKRIVAVGHSAGGHLALWLAGRANLPKDSALYDPHPLKMARVIDLGGLPDLEATAASPDNGCGTDVVARLTGRPTPARPDVYRDISIPRLLPLSVPQDLVNGREDRIIPLRFATDYERRARAAGDTVTLSIIPSTGHVELIAPESAAWAKGKRLIAAAFD